MNRQARRTAKAKARAQTKVAKKGAAFLKPLAFGVYYKGDTNKGCGMTLSVSSGIDQEVIQTIHAGSIEMTEATFEDTQHLTNDELVAETEGWVAEFNKAIFNTNGEQPPFGVQPEFEVNTVTLFTVFTMVASYIAVLKMRGLLQDDNQNGWHVIQSVKV